MMSLRAVAFSVFLVGCSSSSAEETPPADAGAARSDAPADAPPDAPAPGLVVVTFNVGTPRLAGDAGTVVGDHYGTGLAVPSLIEEVRRFLAEVDPDVVAFQEIFHSPDCATLPPEHHAGFVCETWQSGDPTVAQTLLGDAFQIACNTGKTDKCIGVNRRLGTFRGCGSDSCLDGLEGGVLEGCGSGSRVGRGRIDTTAGTTLTVVGFHGTSGIAPEDSDCRRRQVDQVFVDLGDGSPAADGEVNLVLGDFNVDPGRQTSEPSAVRWNELVGEGKRFHFVTDVGPDAPGSYLAGLFDIDHVVSDRLDGSCWIAGITEGRPPVTRTPSFDHSPVVCEVFPR